MTADLIPFPDRTCVGDFGGCPLCGHADGFLDDEREHWFVCQRHRRKWWGGSGLFSEYLDETESDWQRNRAILARYREVDPLPPGSRILDYETVEVADMLADADADRRHRKAESEPSDSFPEGAA